MQGAFHALFDQAYNGYLVPHFDATVSPPIPSSNYDDEAEGMDWETQQDGVDDGEQEWIELGFDSLDDNALALYLRKRDGVRLTLSQDLGSADSLRVDEDVVRDGDEDDGTEERDEDEDERRE